VNDIWPIAFKAVNGGLFVVAFSLVGETATPKRFAGLFSAAPSIALASLLITAIASGNAAAKQNSQGMIVGAIALVVATLAGLVLLRHARAKPAVAGVCAVWLAVAGLGFVLVWR
jgi:uncharacterized membrane protein (GlpM family)